MTFSEKLTTLRKNQNLSQEELAAKLGVSRQAVSRWEMGITLPDAVNLLQLSRLFSVSTDYLLYDETDTPLRRPQSPSSSSEAYPPMAQRTRILVGLCVLALGVIGLVAVGLYASSAFLSLNWIGPMGFFRLLRTLRIGWLFLLLVAFIIAGIFILEPRWPKRIRFGFEKLKAWWKTVWP